MLNDGVASPIECITRLDPAFIAFSFSSRSCLIPNSNLKNCNETQKVKATRFDPTFNYNFGMKNVILCVIELLK